MPSDFNPYIETRQHEILEDGTDTYYDDLDSYEELMRHHNRLAEQDRLAEKAPRAVMHLAYEDRPPRPRREVTDETRVRALLRPRTGEVEVQPRISPLDQAA